MGLPGHHRVFLPCVRPPPLALLLRPALMRRGRTATRPRRMKPHLSLCWSAQPWRRRKNRPTRRVMPRAARAMTSRTTARAIRPTPRRPPRARPLRHSQQLPLATVSRHLSRPTTQIRIRTSRQRPGSECGAEPAASRFEHRAPLPRYPAHTQPGSDAGGDIASDADNVSLWPQSARPQPQIGQKPASRSRPTRQTRKR